MEPTENDLNYKWGVFYFNKNDPRYLVPKRTKMLGWTFNFAHERVYQVSILILVALALLNLMS